MKSAVICFGAWALLSMQLTWADAAEYDSKGQVWKVTLSHAEVDLIYKAGTAASVEIPNPVAAGVVGGCAAGLKATDEVGGNNGVVAIGVGPNLTFITPPQDSPYKIVAETDAKVIDALAKSPGSLIARVTHEAGELSKAFDDLGNKMFGTKHKRQPESAPDGTHLDALSKTPNDRTEFLITYLTDAKVGILTPKGWLQAEGGGGKDARTKIRPDAGGWETWEIETWSDKAVSFRTKDGKWRLGVKPGGDLCAEVPFKGGDLQSVAKFRLEFGLNGMTRLHSDRMDAYVAVK